MFCVFRVEIDESFPCIIDVCINPSNSNMIGTKVCVPVMPLDAFQDMCHLFQEAVNHVKGSDREYQSSFLELPIAEVGHVW